MVLTITLNGVLFLAATEYVKASFHVGAYVGTVYAISLLVHPWLASLLLISPLLAWARSYRGRHTFAQSLLGGTISIFTTAFIFKLLDLA
jgi:hypothetical protein